MSQLAPYRAFNRSQRVRISGKTLSPTVTSWINIDSSRSQRGLAAHSSIGAVRSVGAPFYHGDDGVIERGALVTTRATTLVVDVSAGSLVSAAGTRVAVPAATGTVTTADATNPRIDTIVLNTSTGAVVVVAGTATAGAHLSEPSKTGFRAGAAAIPASRIAIAHVLVPANATTLLQANVLDVRP